jgi:Ca2+-binding RTX toxin-like protein
MALTVDSVKTKLNDFFTEVKTSIVGDIVGKALPLLGKLADFQNVTQASDPFGDLQKLITDELDKIDPANIDPADIDILGVIVRVINEAAGAAGLQFLSAERAAGDVLRLKLGADVTVDGTKNDTSVGFDGGSFLQLHADVSAKFIASLRVSLDFEQDGDVLLADAGSPEVTVKLDALFNLDAAADLGIAKVNVLNTADVNSAEFNTTFTLDLKQQTNAVTNQQEFAVDTLLSATAGLNLDFKTSDVMFGLLPNIKGNFSASFAADTAGGFKDAAFGLNDVTLDLKSYLSLLGKVFGEYTEILNSGALNTVVDVMTQPISPLQDAFDAAGPSILGFLDKVGAIGGGGDGKITIGDIALYGSSPDSSLFTAISNWYTAIGIIDILRKLVSDDPNAAEIPLLIGDVQHAGGILDLANLNTSSLDLTRIQAEFMPKVQGVLDDLGIPGGVSGKIQDLVNKFIEAGKDGATDAGGGGASVGVSEGFSFPLIDDPSNVFKLLLGSAPVELVEYDVPSLNFEFQARPYITLFGFLNLGLNFEASGTVDFDIGYDTNGLLGGGAPNFFNGIYFSTKADSATTPRFPSGPAYLPVGFADATIGAFASAGFGVYVGAELGLSGELQVYFKNEKWYPTADGFSCAFNPLIGRMDAYAEIFIEIGIDPFSFRETLLEIGRFTIADFEAFLCPSPKLISIPQAEGLASPENPAVDPSLTPLLLNVGDRASLRKGAQNVGDTPVPLALPDNPATAGVDESKFESYTVVKARDAVGSPPDQTFANVANAIDVFAFGFQQRFTGPTVIRGDFGDGKDAFRMEDGIFIRAEINGGTGDDIIATSSADDFINGGADSDILSGFDGNDEILGGSGNDDLRGGKGADILDGGSGDDRVSYAGANRDSGVGVDVQQFGVGLVFLEIDYSLSSKGGEAEGDVLKSIEFLTGTDFNDTLISDLGQRVTINGGTGDDYIRGGRKGDILEGGQGADTIIGGQTTSNAFGTFFEDAASDQGDTVSYLRSNGAVRVDLNRTSQFGGHAQGDRLFSIENVQGSMESDTLSGNSSANILDGAVGNDSLDGRGGVDELYGRYGNDIIYGYGDGDLLDGGDENSDRDILNYERATTSITVDLGASEVSFDTGFGIIRNFNATLPDRIRMEQPATLAGRGYSSFEVLIGSSFGDNLTGDIGNNIIFGRGGADTINGDAGNDEITGGLGADAIDGGAGVGDIVLYDDSFEGVTVNLTATGSGGTAAGDTYTNVENILGSFFADSLTGNAVDNVINPNISGIGGTEFVNGGANAARGDTLYADYSKFGVDVVLGVTGGFGTGSLTRRDGGGVVFDQVNFVAIENLHIVGTRSADNLQGGAGNDIFITGDGEDIINTGSGADKVIAGRDNDTVSYGANPFGGTDVASAPATTFFLDGGLGVDTLNIDLSSSSTNIYASFPTNGAQTLAYNLFTFERGAAVDFEILGYIATGSGMDFVEQGGRVNNIIHTGAGGDEIRSGLGFDVVDGGVEIPDGTTTLELSDTVSLEIVVGNAAFADTKLDRVVLDYSGLAAGAFVSGNTELRITDVLIGRGNTISSLLTNQGVYEVINAGIVTDRASLDNIEGLTITGSSGNDQLGGTGISSNSYFQFADTAAASRFYEALGGDDIIKGGAGKDTILTYSGDDVLDGGADDDILIGSINRGSIQNRFGQQQAIVDGNENDVMTGGTGADTFWLGDESGMYYVDAGDGYFSNGKATITDFNVAEGDTIQLFDIKGFDAFSQYTVTFDLDGSALLNVGTQDNPLSTVLAKLQGVTSFDLSANYVTYVPVAPLVAPAILQLVAPLTSRAATLDVAPTLSVASLVTEPFVQTLTDPALPLAPLADRTAQWVTETNSIASLKGAFEGTAAIAGSSLVFDGNAQAVGTFNGDPFGLGTGIILSTGRVLDLPGKNTIESGGGAVSELVLQPTAIGRIDAIASDFYRVDLRGLGFDIRSLELVDSNSRVGGGGGVASGFDLTTIFLSRVKIDSLTQLSQLDPALTQPLSVFDFTSSGINLNQGSQRPAANGFDYGPDLLGTLNGLPTNNNGGAITMGDGGSIGFDLTAAVTTNAPLYLYYAEGGGIGERADVTISASPDKLEPSADLSTDLGAEGFDGDATSMTYRFTPKAGDNAFSFNMVLFSEELPEYLGIPVTDLFTVKLNGVDIGSLNNGASLTLADLVFSSSDLISNGVGTGLLADKIKADAYTKTLTIKGDVIAGIENVLTIEVNDGRDAFLDSGVLIQGGSFKTFVKPSFAIEFGNQNGSTVVVGGGPTELSLELPSDMQGLTKPVTVKVIPSFNIDLGAGAGEPIEVVFQPGETGPTKINVVAPGGSNEDLDGKINFEIHYPDDSVVFEPLPPIEVDLVEPENVAPDLGSATQSISIVENTREVTTLSATDANLGQTLTYAIVAGADKALFTINSATGALSFKNAPDFELPTDVGKDNRYNVVVEARDNGRPALADTQEIVVDVTDAGEMSVLSVNFIQRRAGFVNTLGWYNTETLAGGVIFGALTKPGSQAVGSFKVETADVSKIAFFLIPNGGSLNRASQLDDPIKIIQENDGDWVVALAKEDGTLVVDRNGHPVTLHGSGADALFTETAKNKGSVDYASAVVGTTQTAATLAGDTADGPTGQMAWEDLIARLIPDGTYGKPGDADYDDAVFMVSEVKGQTLHGTETANSLTGNISDDVIYGLGGADNLMGGAGDDHLYGGAGNDKLSGGIGNDILVGGIGADSLEGGMGVDRFVFNDLTVPDTIRDFRPGVDRIVLDNSVFTALSEGDLNASAFQVVRKNFNPVPDADDRIIYNQKTGTLSYDADGSGTAQSAIVFANIGKNMAITDDDFFVV